MIFLFSSPAWAGWYSVGGTWTNRLQVTVSKAMVSNTLGAGFLSDFPLLISIVSDNDLKAQAQASGQDILFTSADGTTKLSHEIEAYDSATGKLTAWVKVPTLSATSDTVLFMYFGNASAADQQDAAGTWSAGYDSVFHMGSTTGSVNGVNTTLYGNTAVSTSCKAGSCYTFDGVGDYLDIDGTSSTATFSFSAWVRPDVVNSDDWFFSDASDRDIGVGGGRFRTFVAGWYSTSHAPSVGNWYYITYTQNAAAGSGKFYVNGVKDTTVYTQTLGAVDIRGAIGTDLPYPTYGFVGRMDEVRLSTIERSADWIMTEFNNQNAAGSYITLGTTGVRGFNTLRGVSSVTF